MVVEDGLQADELGHEILGGAEPDLGAVAELQAQVAAVRGDGDGLGPPRSSGVRAWTRLAAAANPRGAN